MKQRFFTHKLILFISIASLMLLALIGTSSFLYLRYQKTQLLAKNPELTNQQEIASLVKKVSSLILLPTNEVPTVATVSDLTALKDQPFFTNAQNGDKVLLYSKEKLAILYSPSKNLVLAVTPLNVSDSGDLQPQASSTQPAYTIEIRNGTRTSTATHSIMEALKDNKIYTIQKTGEAQKKSYTKTTIVSNSKIIPLTTLSDLAKYLSADIATGLPEGEATSSADIIVIAGTDKIQ